VGTWSWECAKGCGTRGSGNDYDEQVENKADHEAACTYDPNE
jgi:hypothetical protein